ncbi:hypothetical protein CUD01_28090 [Cellulomonas uda]|uniref:Antitoxin VbhA domain-containing protein n=1 Tax=Cellulomonas uda TaxID=1714 RepID=A0A4Y3KH05_CELUD|nr:hypothetical protein CUD01_28090 [Cellulomonas uda]
MSAADDRQRQAAFGRWRRDQNRLWRERVATEAQVSAALAGHQPDPWLDDLTERWVAGDLTLEQMCAPVEARYVSPHPDQEEQ